MATTMTVQCPSCDASFPVDPAKVPESGVRTQCTVCHTHFRVDRPEAEAWEDPGAAAPDAPSIESRAPEATYDWSGEVEPAPDEGEFDSEVIASGFGLEADVEGVDADETADELASPPEQPEVALEHAPQAGLEHALDVEPEAGEPLQAMEAGEPDDGVSGEPDADGDDWGSGVELDDEWVLETESTAELTDVEIEVERLDTVEEQLRQAQDVLPEPGISKDLGIEPAEGLVDFMSEDLPPSSGETEPAPEELAVEAPEGLEQGYGDDFAPAGTGEPGGDEDHAGIEVEALQPVGEFTVEQEEYETYGDADDGEEAPPRETEAAVEVQEPEGTGDMEPELSESEAEPDAEVEPEVHAEPSPSAGFQMGRRDPHEKARRLARVLVSDMITYNPDRYSLALQWGSLKDDFAEEISKSWAEYVEQVGQELAESTPYWSEALNEILAKGKPLF